MGAEDEDEVGFLLLCTAFKSMSYTIMIGSIHIPGPLGPELLVLVLDSISTPKISSQALLGISAIK
jgi:hypothetical protein